MQSHLKRKSNRIRYPINKIQRRWINQEICSETLTQPLILKYILYGIIGGFYHSKYFKRWIKFAWTILTLSSYFIVVIIGCGGYWLTTENIPSSEISHLILLAIINTFVFIITPAFTYRHRRELETILDFVDKEWKHKGSSRELESRLKAREKFTLYYIASISLCMFVFILLHPFDKLIYNPSRETNLMGYVFPVPWLHRINSTILFLLIFIIQYMCMLVSLLVLISWDPFFISLAYQIYDAFSITCDRMHQFSAQAEDAFEKTYEKFSCCEDTFVFGNKGLQLAAEKKNIALRCEIELHRSRLLQNVLIIAREHQQLRSKIRMIKPFAEAYLSIFLPVFFCGQLSTIYTMLAQNLTTIQCAHKIVGIAGGFHSLFSLAYFGKLFDDMEEMFSYHVYNIPWYYFNPQQRKTFFVLLNQSTRRIRFFALKMFPFVPETCLNISKLIYSFASFLYGEIHKRHIR